MQFWIGFLFLATAALANPVTDKKKIDDEQNELATSFEHFSTQMYKHTAAANEGKNLVMSPLSAQVALAFLSMGAEGSTLDEINTALHLKDKDFTESAFRTAMRRLNEPPPQPNASSSHRRGRGGDPPTLNVVNKVYVMDKYELAPKFKSVAKDAFHSEAETVNFGKSADAANTINHWVESKTHNKIKDLIKKDDLSQDTRLVLVNAIYFKGSWQSPFFEEYTRKDDFYLGDGKKVKVDMMTTTSFFDSAVLPDWDAKMIKLPFVGGDVAMVIVVPNKYDGLAAVERKIASEGLTEAMKKLQRANTDLRMPKFKIETEIDLKKILPKIGVSKIFDHGAELGGLLTSPERLYVSQAVQKAFIDVNEHGCEAAAATGLPAVLLSMPLDFTVAGPFYYSIVNERGAVFFGGKFIDPSPSSSSPSTPLHVRTTSSKHEDDQSDRIVFAND